MFTHSTVHNPKKIFHYYNKPHKKNSYFSRDVSKNQAPIGCKKIDLSLYLVTDGRYSESYGELYRKVKGFIQAGGTTVQLRFREEDIQRYLELAKLLSKDIPGWNPKASLVINDRPDVALAAGIKAVHLGPTDFPPDEAKKLLGEDSIIGFTVQKIEQLIQGNINKNIDYFGVQAFPSKYSYVKSPKIWGLDELGELVELSKKPIVVIGGLNEKNIRDVLKFLRPGDGVAFVGDVLRHEDTYEVTLRLRNIIDEHFANKE